MTPQASQWPVSRLVPVLLAAAIALPLLVVFASVFDPAAGAAAHVWATAGPNYLANTVALACLVALGALVIGVPCAALAALAEFPGRRILATALALPLAIPAYIAAYAWGDLRAAAGRQVARRGRLRADPRELSICLSRGARLLREPLGRLS